MNYSIIHHIKMKCKGVRRFFADCLQWSYKGSEDKKKPLSGFLQIIIAYSNRLFDLLTVGIWDHQNVRRMVEIDIQIGHEIF